MKIVYKGAMDEAKAKLKSGGFLNVVNGVPFEVSDADAAGLIASGMYDEVKPEIAPAKPAATVAPAKNKNNRILCLNPTF